MPVTAPPNASGAEALDVLDQPEVLGLDEADASDVGRLGGKGASLVFDSADLDVAASHLAAEILDPKRKTVPHLLAECCRGS